MHGTPVRFRITRSLPPHRSHLSWTFPAGRPARSRWPEWSSPHRRGFRPRSGRAFSASDSGNRSGGQADSGSLPTDAHVCRLRPRSAFRTTGRAQRSRFAAGPVPCPAVLRWLDAARPGIPRYRPDPRAVHFFYAPPCTIWSQGAAGFHPVQRQGRGALTVIIALAVIPLVLGPQH
jgi:hypothetical protein